MDIKLQMNQMIRFAFIIISILPRYLDKVLDAIYMMCTSICSSPLQATAWIGTCILAIMAGILFVMLFAYFYRRSHQPPRGVPYGHMEQDKEDIEHERNEKDELPAAV